MVACCARTASGHAAALPSPAMNCRRRIRHPLKLLCGQPIAVRVAWERVASRRGANLLRTFLHRMSPNLAQGSPHPISPAPVRLVGYCGHRRAGLNYTPPCSTGRSPCGPPPRSRPASRRWRPSLPGSKPLCRSPGGLRAAHGRGAQDDGPGNGEVAQIASTISNNGPPRQVA
jgi:hypothetical protein